MEITTRDVVTVLGALFMLAFSGALAEIYRMSAASAWRNPATGSRRC